MTGKESHAKAEAKEHPLLRVQRELQVDYAELARRIRQASGRKSPQTAYVSQIARGHRHPSRKLTQEICKAFPEIDPVELIFFEREGAGKSKRVRRQKKATSSGH